MQAFESLPLSRPQIFGDIALRYEDEHLLVVSKPSGLLSVPGKGPLGADCLITRLQKDYAEALVVHRLDMSTSGLMVLARSKSVHRDLSLAFMERRVTKAYQAIVRGHMGLDEGVIEAPLITDWPNRPRQMICYERGKPSQTRYRVKKRSEDQTLVDLFPITGRSHQLRVHLLSLGHPILGDDLYGGGQAEAERLMLHATELGFEHPVSREPLYFTDGSDFSL